MRAHTTQPLEHVHRMLSFIVIVWLGGAALIEVSRRPLGESRVEGASDQAHAHPWSLTFRLAASSTTHRPLCTSLDAP